MSNSVEVIAVITQVNSIIDEMMVFTDNDKAEKYFANVITEQADMWSESQEEFCTSDDIYSISQTEIDIAIEDGIWQKGDTDVSLVHSLNTINVCGCGTK